MADHNAIPRSRTPDAEPGLRLRLEDRLGLLDKVQIVPFPSFGTPDLLHVRGRVVERKGVGGTTERSSLWRNIVDTLGRLESDEIPGARLRARLGAAELEVRSDNEGFFVANLAPAEPLEPGWHEVELEWLASVGQPAERTVRARVLVPRADAHFAVVSDVDDTIIESHATDKLRQAALTFGKGARERLAFPGVPALYRALQRGPDDAGENPVFYTSRSGWNLVDLFAEFLEANEIPEGPFLLSDLRFLEAPSKVLGDQKDKFGSIDLLLRTYPELPFVLMGDTGQGDPELYLELARVHPGRVRAVYLHDVSGEPRDREAQRAADALAELGVAVHLTDDARSAAVHAAEHGLIGSGGLDEVRRAVEDRRG